MLLSSKILYVEDDDDIRAIVTQALVSEGFEVDAVPSAEDALRHLAAGAFDVMLTDYRLPGENAAWLLRESKMRGLLERMPVIVFSAEVSPVGIEGYTFLRKPIDLDVLSAAIATALRESGPHSRISEARASEPRLLLRLYVTPSSHASQKAIRNLQRVLNRFDVADLRLVIWDVGRVDAAAPVQAVEEDRIVVTPTLVAHTDAGRIWLAGDLSDTAMLEDVLTRALAAPATARA